MELKVGDIVQAKLYEPKGSYINFRDNQYIVKNKFNHRGTIYFIGENERGKPSMLEEKLYRKCTESEIRSFQQSINEANDDGRL